MTAALRNVNDLNEVYKSFRATKETKSESSSKKKDLEEKKKKKRAKKKEKKEKKKLKKKEKKEKKKAKKSKRSSSSSSSSSDDDDDDENDSESTHSESDDDVKVSRKTLLERGSNAIEAVLHILARFPNQRQDLRVLLKNVDDGNAVPIDGIPDEIMKRLLEIVFKNVGMVKLPSTGAWTLTKKRLTRKEFAFAKVALAFEAEEERLKTLRTCMLPWESEEFARKRMEKKKEEMMRERMERNCGREEAEVLTGEEAAARLKEHGQEIDEDTDDDTEKDKGEQQSAKKQGTLKFKEKGTDNDTVGVAPAAANRRREAKKTTRTDGAAKRNARGNAKTTARISGRRIRVWTASAGYCGVFGLKVVRKSCGYRETRHFYTQERWRRLRRALRFAGTFQRRVEEGVLEIIISHSPG